MQKEGDISHSIHCGSVSETVNNTRDIFFHSLTRRPLYINVLCVILFRATYAMFDPLMLHRLFCYALLLCAACISDAQDACIYRSGPILVNPVVVVKHTIHIITSVLHNTTFQVNTDLTLTVDNAPTSLDFLTTYFSRSTAIETNNLSVIPSKEL